MILFIIFYDLLILSPLQRRFFLVSNILALSIVSMLADLSTEMMQPILPLFLVGTMGASYSFVGLIEGSSDSISSLVKVVSGLYSDRMGKRKPFVVLGYLPTAVLKPLLYFAQTPIQVLGIRIPERKDSIVSLFAGINIEEFVLL